MPDLTEQTDEELVRQSQHGSLAAFDALVGRYEHRVYAFVNQFCRNPADAAEVTQDTFVKAFHAIASFDTSLTFAPWLLTIARRKCIDHHRAAPPPADDTLPELADSADPSDALSHREEQQNLWKLARKILPDVQYQSLWLHYAEDLNIAESARVLRKTKTYVKVLLFRARQALAKELRKDTPATRFGAGAKHQSVSPPITEQSLHIAL
jgi:RNA polymerase sigma-70 factor, ECF subfamily